MTLFQGFNSGGISQLRFDYAFHGVYEVVRKAIFGSFSEQEQKIDDYFQKLKKGEIITSPYRNQFWLTLEDRLINENSSWDEILYLRRKVEKIVTNLDKPFLIF